MTGPLDSPGFWLHQAALAWAADLGERLRPLGLTTTQFTLLAGANWLTRDAPVNQQVVADFAGSDRQMASRVLRGLESRGLLTRQVDPTSARSVLVKTTRAGHELVLRAVKLAAESDREIFGDGSRSLLAAQFRALSEKRSRT